jgi:hypothetical protein
MSLSVLAATSTDGMVRRLGGRRWRRLHQSVYVIAVLALVHYFIQSKLNVAEPTAVAGFFLAHGQSGDCLDLGRGSPSLFLVAYEPQYRCGVAHCNRGSDLLPSR